MASSRQVATGNSRKGQKNRNLVPPLEEGATESAKKRRVRLRENLSKRAKRAERAAAEAAAEAAAAQAAEQAAALAAEQLAADQIAAEKRAAKKRKKDRKKDRKKKKKREKKEKEKARRAEESAAAAGLDEDVSSQGSWAESPILESSPLEEAGDEERGDEESEQEGRQSLTPTSIVASPGGPIQHCPQEAARLEAERQRLAKENGLVACEVVGCPNAAESGLKYGLTARGSEELGLPVGTRLCRSHRHSVSKGATVALALPAIANATRAAATRPEPPRQRRPSRALNVCECRFWSAVCRCPGSGHKYEYNGKPPFDGCKQGQVLDYLAGSGHVAGSGAYVGAVLTGTEYEERRIGGSSSYGVKTAPCAGVMLKVVGGSTTYPQFVAVAALLFTQDRVRAPAERWDPGRQLALCDNF